MVVAQCGIIPVSNATDQHSDCIDWILPQATECCMQPVLHTGSSWHQLPADEDACGPDVLLLSLVERVCVPPSWYSSGHGWCEWREPGAEGDACWLAVGLWLQVAASTPSVVAQPPRPGCLWSGSGSSAQHHQVRIEPRQGLVTPCHTDRVVLQET